MINQHRKKKTLKERVHEKMKTSLNILVCLLSMPFAFILFRKCLINSRRSSGLNSAAHPSGLYCDIQVCIITSESVSWQPGQPHSLARCSDCSFILAVLWNVSAILNQIWGTYFRESFQKFSVGITPLSGSVQEVSFKSKNNWNHVFPFFQT